MRRPIRLAAFALAAGLAVAAAAADDPPAPILKAVVPPAGQARVRVPITGDPKTPYRIRAQVPKPGKGKAAGEPVEIVVGINTGKRTAATTAMVKSWGYTPGPDKHVTLPELVLVGYQIAPAPKKGKDDKKDKDSAKEAGKPEVLARIPGFRVECLDVVAEGTDKVLGSDLLVGVHDLTKGQDRFHDPRLYYTDKFLDLTFDAKMVKRLPMPSGEEIDLDPPSKADPKLAVVVAPLDNRKGPVFKTASFNGVDQIKNMLGQTEPVNVMVTAATTIDTGLIMSYGLALDLKLTLDPEKERKDFLTLDKKGKFIGTTVKEMRIAVLTGKDYKVAKDVVIKDLEVVVDTGDSAHYAMVGPNFVNKYFPDAIYTTGADGQLKLYGRVVPDLLHDPKGKKKP
jgi:hypothetical protein